MSNDLILKYTMIVIKSENIERCRSHYVAPMSHENVLGSDDIFKLLEIMHNDENLKLLPGGRKFSTSLTKTDRFLRDIGFFEKVLPIEGPTWRLTGGNYFETSSPYRIHADTGRSEDEAPYRTIVIPLEIIGSGRSSLHIMKQRWYAQAAFFLNGGDKHGYNADEWNVCVFDYSMIHGLSEGRIDASILQEEFPHINPENFHGMDLMDRLDWRIGDVLTFDRSHIHVTNDWRKTGISRKTGLSLFLSLA